MKNKKHPGKEDAPAADTADEEPVAEATSEEPSAAGPPLTPEEIEDLKTRALERDQYHQKFLRARADLENYRKRAIREIEDAGRFALAPFAREILRVRDDLIRTIQAARAAGNESPALMEGLELVRDQLDKTLASFHIKPVPAQGLPFDPNLHETVSLQVTDAFPDHTVIEEVQTGFTIHDRLLRPAKVVIARAAAQQNNDAAQTEGDS